MNTITKDPMNYKTYCKKNESITIRLRIIKHRFVDEMPIWKIALRYDMHRNSVTNIMNLFYQFSSEELKIKLRKNTSLSSEDITRLCSFLLPNSRQPKSHSKQANPQEEAKILTSYETLKVGAKKLTMMLKRRSELENITHWKIKGVYKRHGLKIRKVRTKNGDSRSLYDYQALGAFEHMHFDTKELADAKSLPISIYENLKHNETLPLLERNIIDAASRARFTAYSRGKSSTFWLQFLVFVTSHLRYCWVKNDIHFHTDCWSEFFSWSEKKQQDWNSVLKELDTDIDCYNPNWDIRKNLIERSHKSDDEEFLIPFGNDMNTKERFMLQAQEYNDYRNSFRPHSWKGMDDKTPKEKLTALWLTSVEKILDFNVLFLDSWFHQLQQHLEYFLFMREVRCTPLQRFSQEKKVAIDLLTKYPHLRLFAQNVLTYYRIKKSPLNKTTLPLPLSTNLSYRISNVCNILFL